MKNKHKIGIALSLFLIVTTSVMAGISTDSTRIVFSASRDARGQSVGVSSAVSSPSPYLVKTQVTRDVAGNDVQTPFVTSPSLFRLEPGGSNQVLIVKRASDLPQDRESVFYFRSVAMPAGEKSVNTESPIVGGALKLSTATVIKLFYRPNGLPFPHQRAMSMLQFSAGRQGLEVKNPTPYYITLASLRVGGKAVSLVPASGNTLITPFGQQVYTGASYQGAVEWKAINDYGGIEVFHGSVR